MCIVELYMAWCCSCHDKADRFISRARLALPGRIKRSTNAKLDFDNQSHNWEKDIQHTKN